MTASSPARRAREAAGLDLHEAAVLARISPETLRRCESAQRFTFVLAQRLAGIYPAPLFSFLPINWGDGRPGTRCDARRRNAREANIGRNSDEGRGRCRPAGGGLGSHHQTSAASTPSLAERLVDDAGR